MTTTSETSTPQGVTRWRKRPVTIEAVHLVDDPAVSDPGWEAIADWCGGELVNHEIADSGEYETVLVIRTLEGDMTAVEDDWIIKGVACEFYPCKPEIFAQTHEPADGDQVTVSREDLAQAEADEIARLKGELSRAQSAAQTLGKVIVRLGQSMEAARIEMIQNGPEVAMQWILNSLPDVSDEAPEDQWDGKETATQWIDRTQAAGRAAAAGDPR